MERRAIGHDDGIGLADPLGEVLVIGRLFIGHEQGLDTKFRTAKEFSHRNGGLGRPSKDGC